MDEELKCSLCRRFFEDPILLHCGHSYCRQCALKVQQPACSSSLASSATRPSTPGAVAPSLFSQTGGYNPLPLSPLISSPVSPQCSSASDTISICVSDDHESDKLSVVSETDSGVVVCGRNSRPSSIVGPPISRLPNILTPSTSGVQIVCNQCQKPSYFCDESAIASAPANIAMQNVISRYLAQHPNLASSERKTELVEEKKKDPSCQLCEGSARSAVVFCEQCDIFYCEPCQAALHPARGPLAKHTLQSASSTRKSPPRTLKDPLKCSVHTSEALTMYCIPCKFPVCCRCLQDIRHTNHDVQTLAATCKTHKFLVLLPGHSYSNSFIGYFFNVSLVTPEGMSLSSAREMPVAASKKPPTNKVDI
ncbi:hypothetical protein WR25_07107 [Diploscapter pachys]|uniref:B box-type domain-containing protein n=1 Tax=Diploscapter pachys TaxID=2018661 RepID=A0A2A2LKZ6_9BILA|nr:hypothetical protein WR25_07107 [Diploscapter pachys]